MYQVARHPIKTAEGLANAVMHPVQTAKAIYQDVKEKAGTSQGRGELVFDIATSAISYIKIGKVAKIANAVDNVSDVASGAKTAAGAGKNVAKSANKADNIGQVANSCPKGSKACFTAGTQIVVGAEYSEELNTTVYVTVIIEDIAVGDLVYSYDTVTGIVSQQEVTATFARESDHINYLTFIDESGNEQIIETTDSHPFWVVTDEPDLERAARDIVDENGVILYHENLQSGLNGFWVEAKDLQEGDVFLGANGELSTLVTTERVVFPDGVKVYNFTVEGNHDYFVIAEVGDYGQISILVHNGKCDSALLADDMIKNGIERPADSATHHIIPVREGKAHAARGILEKYEININSYVNGVFLSKAIHRGRHSGDYVKKVNDMIKNNAQSRETVIAKLADIRNGLLDGSIRLN